ncbi:MAG: helix-turn-helix domain-containing protein, partial [Deltaproteobacteria bacterium]|nr:helix-turn-helix domain-containing protein [Deltaproteobacteria bacterium]
ELWAARRRKPKPLVPVNQAASLLGKHPRTIRRWCRQGALDAVLSSSGKIMGITAQSIENLLEEGEGG